MRLALKCRRVHVPGPDDGAVRRMSARFDRFLFASRQSRLPFWLSPWLGKGAARRPLAQRLAAAGLAAGAIGLGGSTAAGISPGGALKDCVELAGSIVANLAPRDGDDGNAGATIEVPAPTTTPTPGASVAATVAATPPAAVEASAGADPGGPQASGAVSQTVEGPRATQIPGQPAGATPDTVPSTPSGSQEQPGPTGSPEADDGADPAETPEPATPAGTIPANTPPAPSSATPVPEAIPGWAPPTPTPTSGSAEPVGFQTDSFRAGISGSVTIRHSPTSLEIVDVAPSPGWTYSIEYEEAQSCKVSFEREGHEVEFEAHLEDGILVTNTTGPDAEESN